MDIVELGMDVDGRPLKFTREEMQKFVREGKRVDGAARGVEKSTNAMGAAMARAAAGIAAAAAAAVSLGTAVQQARQFGAAMGEASTLLQGTRAEMTLMEAEARRLGVTFGTGAKAQVEAFYQAISAGASDVAEASKVLDAANRLAIGGVTNVTVATDILTSAVNVYSASGLTAVDASDALFVAMRAGKTTIDELAGSLGKVLPLASNLGVTFDETAATVAALTKGGIATAEAVTGLRAAMTAILGPSKQAQDLAAQLGINFNAAGLEALGFAGFMEEVVAKTGGSSEAMQTLFSSVEATTVALALAGEAGNSLGVILADMADKSGATADAYQKMASTLDQRLNRAMSALSDIGLTVGNMLLAVAVPALEATAAVAVLVADNVEVLGVAIAALAATRLPALVLSMRAATAGLTLMQAQFIAGAVAARGMALAAGIARGAIALLGGPIGIVFGLATAAAGAFIAFGDNAGEAEKAAEDAAEGHRQLAAAMGAVVAGEKGASASVIALANNNVKLANTAFEAAKAELAKNQAIIDGQSPGLLALLPGGAFLAARRQKELAEATKEQEEALRKLNDAIMDRKFAADQIVATSPQVTETTNEETDAMAALRARIAELLAEINGTGGGSGGAAKAAKNIDALAEEIKRLELDASPVKRYRVELEKLQELRALGLSDAAFEQAVQGLNDELASQLPLVDDLASAWGRFVSEGFTDFKGFAENVLSSFKNLIAQMAATAARNRILIGLGFGGAGLASPAGAAGAALGGGGGLLGGLPPIPGGGGLLGGILGTGGGGLAGLAGSGGIAGGVGSIASGLGGVLSGGGIGSSFANLGGLLTGASGGLAAVGAAIPAIGAVIGGALIVSKIFGGKKKDIDSGITLVLDEMDSFVESFAKRRFSSAGDEIQDPITAVVDDLRGTLTALGDGIGIASEAALEGFAARINISTRRLSDEEIEEKIGAAIGEAGDIMAQRILAQAEGIDLSNESVTRRIRNDGSITTDVGSLPDFTSQFARAGETASQTLQRLAGDIDAVNTTLQFLDQTMLEASIQGADMASSLVQLFGGVQAFDQATTAFFTGFFSEAEQIELRTAALTREFEELGMQLPGTRDGLRQIIEAQDLTTESGRETYAALVQLAAGMGDLQLPLDRLIQTLTGAAQGQAVEAINQVQDMARASGQAANDWLRAADTLRDFLRNLTNSTLSSLSAGQQLSANAADLRRTFQAARGGDIGAARDFTGVANSFLGTARAQASSAVEFRRIEGQVRAQANLLAGMSELESARNTVLESLAEEQVGVLTELRDILASGEQLGPDDLAQFQTRIDGLSAAIADAEMISLDFLQKRLTVAVDLLASANIPPSMRALLENAETGIESSIDFLVRADLTPEQRFLAANAASEHIKTIEFLGDNRALTAAQREITFGAAGSFVQTVQFVARNTMPADLTGLALADAGEFVKAIKFAAQSLSPDVQALVFNDIDALQKEINFRLGDTIPDDQQKLALSEAERFRRVINIVSGQLVPGNVERLALSSPGGFTRALNILAGRVPSGRVQSLALDAARGFRRVINLAAGDDLPDDVMTLALASSSTMTRTLNLVMGRDLPEAEKRLALAGSSELARTINATLAADIDPRAMELALRNTSVMSVNVRAALSASAEVREIVFGDIGTYVASVEAAISSDMSDTARQILLIRQGKYTANILGTLDSSQPDAFKRLLLNSNTTALRGVTIGATMPGISPEERRLLLEESTRALRTIQMMVDAPSISGNALSMLRQLEAGREVIRKDLQTSVWVRNVDMGPNSWAMFRQLQDGRQVIQKDLRSSVKLLPSDMSANSWAMFDQLKAGSSVIQKIINGRVDLEQLSKPQLSLLEAIQGGSTGTLRLGGNFAFDPSAAFSRFFEDTTSVNIRGPMEALRGSLNDLRASLIDLERTRAAREAAQFRQGELSTFLNALPSNGAGGVFANTDQVRQAAAIAGPDLKGAAGTGAREKLASLVPSISEVMVAGGQGMVDFLFGVLRERQVPPDPADYLRIYSDVAKSGVSAETHAPFGRAEILAGTRPFNATAFDWAALGIDVPGFAAGGDFGGGLRIVGERGPELEATGPSRIFSADKTRDMLSGGDPKLVAELVTEVRALREEQRQLGLRADRRDERTAKILKKWDQIGLPAEQV